MPSFVVDTLLLVDTTVKSYTVSAWSDVAAANASSLRLMLILYVALFGMLTWYGALRLSMGQVVKHLITAMMVFTLATSWGPFATIFYDVFTQTPDALSGALAGGGNSASDALGRVFDQGIEAALVVWQQAGPTDLTLALIGATVFIGTVLMTGAALVLIILAKLAMAVLLALGPLFIMLYLFRSTRGFFEGWVRQLANFSLLIVLTFGVLALMLKIIEPTTAAFATKGATIQLRDTAQYLLLAVIGGFLFALIPGFAAGVVGGFALHASSALGAAAAPIRAMRQEAGALAGDWMNRAAGLRTWQRSLSYRSGAAVTRGGRALYSPAPQAVIMAGRGKMEVAPEHASTDGTDAHSTAVGDPTVENWFYDRYQSARINGNRWFVVAILFGVLASLAVAAVIVLTPLKTVQPFVVEVNNASGEVRTLKALDADELTPSDAVIKSFLAKYVIARETYDPQDLKENYQAVRLLSDPAESLRVDGLLAPTNTASPLNRYQNHTVRSVKVKSVSFLNRRTAQVRFASTETARTAKKEETWVAIVSFRFVNLPEAEEERFINPLGFQVTAYRVDQELVQ